MITATVCPAPAGACIAGRAGTARSVRDVLTRRDGTMATDDRSHHDQDTTVTTDGGAHATRGAARDAVAAQRARFGGIKWGAAFFGWLTANGLAVVLIALLSAAGVAIGLTNGVDTADEAAAQADTLGIGGGIAILVVLFLAYLAGGYVAGRMARFDGVRQGLAVWIIGLVVVLLLALAGVVLGAQYNVLQQLNLPRIPIDEGTATTAGIITLVAILGGKLGTRYHRRIDRAGFDA